MNYMEHQLHQKSTSLYGVDKWNSEPNINTAQQLSLKNKCNKLDCFRLGANVHKYARKYLQAHLKPNMTFTEICTLVETKVNDVLGNTVHKSMGFPVGISVNNIAAHDSANIVDNRIITEHDIIKIDFGTQINGYIIDSAFTVTFDPVFEPLLQSSKEATMNAIKMARSDTLINDISAEIKETIESYELELNGKTYKINPVKTLGGHTIEQYKIHAGKIVLCHPHLALNGLRIEEGETYAIETFASTGKGITIAHPKMECNHFMFDNLYKSKYSPKYNVGTQTYDWIINNRNTMPFASRWIYNNMQSIDGLNELVNKKIVNKYPPLVDVTGSYVSQYEHTIHIGKNSTEVFSIGDDY